MMLLMLNGALATDFLMTKHHIEKCKKDFGPCQPREARLPTDPWSFRHWAFRRELAHLLNAHIEEMPVPERFATMVCDQIKNPLGCFSQNDRASVTTACQLGDNGACLLDVMDRVPTEPAAAMVELESLCTAGAANACAWHLELVRAEPSPDLKRPFFQAQRACFELAEPVACAAAGKTAHQLGMASHADFLHRTACRWGYLPSCTEQLRNSRTLIEEEPPSVLGPSMVKPGTLDPLPGRPRLPPQMPLYVK